MSLAKHVEPRLGDARLARQWDTVAARLDARPRPSRVAPWAVAGLFAALGVAAVAVLWKAPPASSLEGAVVTTGADVVDLRFGGSRVTIERESTLALVETAADRVRLDLRAGTARFDVAHREGRTFVVTAGPAEVDVVGTLFRVTNDAGTVTVSVARGAVEVLRTRGAATTRLAAGETWSMGEPRARSEPPANPIQASPPASEAPAAESPTTAAPPPRLAAAPTAAPETAAPTVATASARELFDLANVARRDRRLRDAADAYDAVLRRFPSDSRAGLAAYELGRLRMDALDDLPGAIDAFERAASSASVREGAMARVVEAYERTGRAADCTRARDAYLARYPSGVQAATIRGRCGGH